MNKDRCMICNGSMVLIDFKEHTRTPCPKCNFNWSGKPEDIEMNNELMPCPFCGEEINEPESIPQNDGSTIDMIQCCNCGLTMFDITKDGLLKTWNTRI